ncbi:MAG TPA: phosphopantetheine-binding protein [Acidimicrobiales bacterium]|nr:phosphopantetheine-binding protein [Acidimicrobiales bacterium]
MSREEALGLMRAVLRQVAPEADLDDVGPDESLREALDLDSMDFLNFVIGVHERTGIEIPERDYPELASVDGFVGYLVARSGIPAK